MKVLIVVGRLGLGGAERQALALARGLGDLGHQARVAVFRDGGAMQADAVATGVAMEVLSGSNAAARIASLRGLIARERPDVVHGYLTAGNLACLCARTLTRRPLLVWGIRASDMRMENYGIKWRWAAWLERRLMPLADLLIVNSQSGLEVLRAGGVPDRRIVVLENGIDLARFAPHQHGIDHRRNTARVAWNCRDDTAVIGHVARIDPMKDHSGFLQALALLRHQRTGWKAVLVAVGSQEQRDRLTAEAASLGLGEDVVVIPAAADIASLYPGFDVACSSSAYGEGFSNVIAEALASGLPVVATDVGDARRIVGPCGRIVPPGAPEILADALSDVLDRRDVLSGMARGEIAPL